MSLRTALNAAPMGGDPFAAFLPVAIDDAGAVQYFGYEAITGAWIIKQFNTTEKTILYVGGDSEYEAAWAARETLIYRLPSINT